MKYDFDEIISRRNSNSYKWDAVMEEGILPMWVTDMDFRTAPAVVEMLHKWVDHGIFGHTKALPVYYDVIISWFTCRYGWQIDRDWTIYTSGVVPAPSAIIKALTVPGSHVLVQTPIHNCFFSSICNNGCEIVANPPVYTNGTYRIDFDDLARKATDPKVRLLLLCNPHSPVGRIWTWAELMCISETCPHNDVLVVADEIYCELVYLGHTYISFASISDDFRNRSVTCTSPSKVLNLAGLQIANIFAADESVCVKIDKAINSNEVCDVNPFGVEALVVAYNDGEEWLKELRCYLSDNHLYMRTFFNKYLPQFPVARLEGTYLVWVDCSVLDRSSKEVTELLLKVEKLWVSEGSVHGEVGEGFIRINIVCPRQILIDGLNRLKRDLREVSLRYCRDRQILLHDTIG